jgi:PBSX family phage portal protein
MPKRTRKEDTNVHVLRGALQKRADASRQIEIDDPFSDTGLAGHIIETPYILPTLIRVFDQSNILRQCVESYAVNIASFGYRIVPVSEDVETAPAEKKLLQSYIDSANTEESLVAVNRKKIKDYEKLGFAFLEVIRNAKKVPTLIRHIKGYAVRLMPRDPKAVPVTRTIQRGGSRKAITEYKRFRRYMQIVNGTQIYFKEFGDPRVMDYRSGRYQEKGYTVPIEFQATEILHQGQYAENLYGSPRWVGQLPSILGSREAEEVNYRYFQDNTIPPMILSVAGGRLTKQSFNDLKRLLSEDGIGRDRQHQILLIEAIPETAGLDEGGTVKLQVDKLSSERPSDGLFKDYDDSNIAKIMSAFRLPPVMLGMSGTVNFATAQVSAYLAETQVFAPERDVHDEFINKRFVNHPDGLGLKTVKLETKGPMVTNPDQIVKALTAVNVMGGVTPRKAVDIVNQTMQLSLVQYPEKGEPGYEEWMDLPMQIAQRRELQHQQQKDEGDTMHDEQDAKPDDIKEREKDGETGIEDMSVEHGQE